MKKQLSLIRTAISSRGRPKTSFLSVRPWWTAVEFEFQHDLGFWLGVCQVLHLLVLLPFVAAYSFLKNKIGGTKP